MTELRTMTARRPHGLATPLYAGITRYPCQLIDQRPGSPSCGRKEFGSRALRSARVMRPPKRCTWAVWPSRTRVVPSSLRQDRRAERPPSFPANLLSSGTEWIAVARPIPLPAPVMKATLPASLGIDLSSAIANLKTAGRRRFTMRYRSALNSGGECHGRRATIRSSLVRRRGDRC